MIYSDRKRFIFFAAGKTGTTSIERAPEEYADPIPFEYDRSVFGQHIPPEYARAHLPKKRPYYLYEVRKRNRGIFDERCFWLHWNHMERYRRGIDSDNRYQHRFLSDAGGSILVDLVGRYERLQDDFDHACDTIGVPRRALAFENRGTFRRGDRLRNRKHSEFYTPVVAELVRKHYAKDIREFGYKFEPESEG